uniref:Uncharacterized protein n=1 Tax=Poecilia formosa TaxID=48698 RepID=A0A096MA64_POEFO
PRRPASSRKLMERTLDFFSEKTFLHFTAAVFAWTQLKLFIFSLLHYNC